MLNEVVTDVKVGSKSPIRSCVACRLKSDKKDLLRFVYTIDRKMEGGTSYGKAILQA